MITIRRASPGDRSAIWTVIGPVIRAGETYSYDADWPKDDALDYWMGADKHTFVAEENDQLLGTYYIRTNQMGGGRHVCNCGYMTSEAARGRGLARAMCQHSMPMAVELGYKAMQFNFVVSTNEVAVGLWKRLGFDIVGVLPRAFNHPTEGLVDAFVMYQWLATDTVDAT